MAGDCKTQNAKRRTQNALRSNVLRFAIILARMDRDFAIGIDMGGTSVVAGVLRRDGALLSRRSMPTDSQRGIADGLMRLAQLADDVLRDAGIPHDGLAGIGIGASAPIDRVTGRIHNPFTLPGWDGIPAGAHLAQHLGVPFKLIGDCDAAALGEQWQGAGRGARSLIYITVGTGIGSGIILDGQLRSGVGGATCEAGHIVIDMHGPQCYCGARGCLEMLAAAPAIVKRGQAIFAQAPMLRALCNDDPQTITAKMIHDAAVQGDAAAMQVMRNTGVYLGVGLASLMNLLAPERIILGGGVMQGWDVIAPALFDTLRTRGSMVPFDQIEIMRAALGLNAGITGAASVLFE
jgi:glucokinase